MVPPTHHLHPAEEQPRLFPLFRPRAGSKRVYIVRHGESAYNEAMSRSASWADPLIFDARLTEKGRQQVGGRDWWVGGERTAGGWTDGACHAGRVGGC